MSNAKQEIVRNITDEGKRALAAIPHNNIHKQYRFETQSEVAIPGQREGTWRGSTVKIYREGDDTLIHEFTRNYPSAMKTYDVFRWWHSDLGEWRDYAVISPDYLGFEIIDLATGTKVAETEEEDKHTFSFCPVEFYVPDFWDVEIIAEYEKHLAEGESVNMEYYEECMNAFLAKRSFGFVSGTVWGDDWAWKLAQLDLRNLLDGKAAIVERFGYYPLPHGISLRDAVGHGEGGASSDYFTDMGMDNLDLATFNTIRLHPDGTLGETFTHAILPEEIEKLRAEQEKEDAEQSA